MQLVKVTCFLWLFVACARCSADPAALFQHAAHSLLKIACNEILFVRPASVLRRVQPIARNLKPLRSHNQLAPQQLLAIEITPLLNLCWSRQPKAQPPGAALIFAMKLLLPPPQSLARSLLFRAAARAAKVVFGRVFGR